MSTLQADLRPRILDSYSGERRRPFGSDFSQQSLTYLLYLPCLLGTCAAATWLVPTDTMFLVGAMVGGGVGLYALLDVMFRNAPLRFTSIYAMTVLLAYNLGAVNSWFTLKRASLTLAEAFARDPAALAHAIAACMATAALLFVIGQIFERPVFGRDFCLNFGWHTLPLVSVGTLMLLGAYASGKVGYMGINIDETGHLNPAVALIMWWIIPAFAYSVCATLNSTGLTRWALAALTLVQALAMVPFGRTHFAFALLLALIATRLGKYRIRMPIYKRVLIGAAGIVVILTMSVAFIYLRVAGYQQKEKLPVGTRLKVAYDLLGKRSPTEILELMGTDASSRTFMIGFFSDLLDASQHSTPLLGRDLLYNIQLTVPSVISRDKFGIVPYGEEILVNIQWGFAYIDEANSLLTAGAADFGFVGVILYPIVLVLMLRVALEWIQYVMPTNIAAIIALAYIFQALQAEDVPAGYFLQLRTTLLVALIFYVLVRLPAFRLRPAN